MAEIPALRVGACMATRIVFVAMDGANGAVRVRCGHARSRQLLVTEQRRLAGVVSDADFLEAIRPNIGRAAETSSDRGTLNTCARQIMTRHPETIRRDALLAEASRRFDAAGVRLLPVPEDDEAIAGVLSWRDIIRALARDGQAPEPEEAGRA